MAFGLFFRSFQNLTFVCSDYHPGINLGMISRCSFSFFSFFSFFPFHAFFFFLIYFLDLDLFISPSSLYIETWLKCNYIFAGF